MKLERIVIVCALGLTSLSQAQLVNASFEEPPVGAGVFNNLVAGWSDSGGGGVWNIPLNGFFNLEAPDGTQIGYTNGNSLAQQSTASLVAGLNEVSVQAGRRGDSFAGSFNLELWVGGTVSLGSVAGGELLASSSFNHTTVNPNSFTLLTTTFNAASNDPRLGQLLSVRILRTTGQANFDDVRMSAVPEPATLAALAIGAFLVRRRKSA